jgi:hypothetical protein
MKRVSLSYPERADATGCKRPWLRGTESAFIVFVADGIPVKVLRGVYYPNRVEPRIYFASDEAEFFIVKI